MSKVLLSRSGIGIMLAASMMAAVIATVIVGRVAVSADPDAMRVPADEAALLSEEVGFNVAVPMDPGQYRIIEMSAGGPEQAPRVMMAYFHAEGDLSMIHFLQSEAGLGESLPLNQSTGVRAIAIEGAPASVELGRTSSGDDLIRIAWEANGVTYQLGATNVVEDELMAFARSIALVAE